MKIAIAAEKNSTLYENHVRSLCRAAEMIDKNSDIELWLFGECFNSVENFDFPVNEVIGIKNRCLDLKILKEIDDKRNPDVLILYGDKRGVKAGTEFGIIAQRNSWNGVNDIFREEGKLQIRKGVYGYNLTAVFEVEDENPVFIIEPDSFKPSENKGRPEFLIYDKSFEDEHENIIEKTPIESGDELEQAEVVLICGRGAEGESAEKIRELAKIMNVPLGGTRPFVLDTQMPENSLIGVSGSRISPKLCIVFGASGSKPFFKGIEKSQCIIGINKDEDAMLFRQCDAGIVGDCQEIAQELIHKMR